MSKVVWKTLSPAVLGIQNQAFPPAGPRDCCGRRQWAEVPGQRRKDTPCHHKGGTVERHTAVQPLQLHTWMEPGRPWPTAIDEVVSQVSPPDFTCQIPANHPTGAVKRQTVQSQVVVELGGGPSVERGKSHFRPVVPRKPDVSNFRNNKSKTL